MATRTPLITRDTLALGVELEMYLRLKDTPAGIEASDLFNWRPVVGDSFNGRDRTTFLRVLGFLLARRGIKTELEDLTYQNWAILCDTSLTKGEGDGFMGIELISPANDCRTDWVKQLFRLYQVLNNFCDIKVDERCSTHVHVSPSPDGSLKWTQEEIAVIYKNAFLFDDSITAMLPPDRKENTYAVSNFRRQKEEFTTGERAAPFLELSDRARASGDSSELFSYIDNLPDFSAIASTQSNRWVRFNFGNLKGKTGTVEVRCPPPSGNAVTAAHWAAWVLSFCFAALHAESSSQRPRRDATSVSHLRSFIWTGYKMLNLEGAANRKVLIWELLTVIDGASTISAEMHRKMEMIKAEKIRSEA